MNFCTRTTAVRLDAVTRRVDDGTGYLEARAFLTKPGVFSYYDSKTGKVRRELRADEEVFHPNSVASAKNRPFTNNHPPVMLNAKNTRQHQAGFFYGEVEKIDNYLASSLLITDEATISDYDSGKRDVSMGYRCKLDETPGVHPKYGPYDAAQKLIRYNHGSLVQRGRMGPDCSVRADALELPPEDQRFDAYELPEITQSRKDRKMGTIRLDDATLEADDAVAVAVNAHIQSLAKANKELTTKLDTIEGVSEQLKTNLAELKEKVDAFEKVDHKAAAKEWADVTAKANAFLPKDFKMDAAESPVDVMRAALQAAYPDQDLTGKSDDHIRGRFDMLEAKTAGTKTQPSGAFQAGINNKLTPPSKPDGQRNDGKDQPEDPGLAAYQSMYPGLVPAGGN